MASGPWLSEGREPSAEEWVDWFLSLERGAQLEVAKVAISDRGVAVHAFVTGRSVHGR